MVPGSSCGVLCGYQWWLSCRPLVSGRYHQICSPPPAWSLPPPCSLPPAWSLPPGLGHYRRPVHYRQPGHLPPSLVITAGLWSLPPAWSLPPGVVSPLSRPISQSINFISYLLYFRVAFWHCFLQTSCTLEKENAMVAVSASANSLFAMANFLNLIIIHHPPISFVFMHLH